MFSHESDILRKIRLIEWLKAELVTSVGQVFQAIAGYVPLDVARRCFRNHCYESVNFLLVPRTTRDKPAGAQGHAD